MAYNRSPVYAPVHGAVTRGWDALWPALPDTVVAIDGPPALDWDQVLARAGAALPGRAVLDTRSCFRRVDEVLELTTSADLAGDPNFDAIPSCALADLLDPAAVGRDLAPGTLVVGPGAAAFVAGHRVWLDRPKRYAEAALARGEYAHLGGLPGPSYRRLFYADWPLSDKHRDANAARWDTLGTWRDDEQPTWADRETWRTTVESLSTQAFRVMPYVNSTPWGGQWAASELGFPAPRGNTALGYEFIAPENGVQVGDAEQAIEIPFQLVCALHPESVLGEEIVDMFGASFPIRMDYLDTMGGGNLSLHCHPTDEYMAKFFGWRYTQHESYYTSRTTPGASVFLGLRGDCDLTEFAAAAHRSAQGLEPLAVEDFVQRHDAREHQLYLIPAGTPHASGVDNLVLEISATPYLYSLRFYDWMRTSDSGAPRAVHEEHAFANVAASRRGRAVVDELIPRAAVRHEEDGVVVECLSELDDLFFDVWRTNLAGRAVAHDDTHGRFHLLNLVDGDDVVITTAAGVPHALGAFETILVPASVGAYTLTARSGPARVVKALVR
ncbi:class I mannose-6-phosphate isomerase [Mariniluteicoccus flavus]